MTPEKIKFAKLFTSSKAKAIASITECYHPNCTKKSINSNILQKNGILSSIAPERHLWELIIDNFSEPYIKFKRTGINQIFSFNCFCNEHDTELFKKIETGEIDFDDYESCLLFTLRTVYNEIFKKDVNLKMYDLLIKSKPEIFDSHQFLEHVRQEKLGRGDLEKIVQEIWADLNNGTESYIFENRKMERLELCVSAFYDYDTSNEMNEYRIKYGKDMERVSEVFINSFPYQDYSVLLMAYNKKDEKKLKGYFYTFFKEKEKRVQKRITNLVLFQCETWVSSDKFYKKNIEGIEKLYSKATRFSSQNGNERKTYNLNFYELNFRQNFEYWCGKYVG